MEPSRNDAPTPLIFSRHLEIRDSSYVGEATRSVAALCRDLGFEQSRIDQVILVVTELATNLIKHTAGAGGDLIFRPLIEVTRASGVEILALDRGPGIVNMGEALRGGYSTAGSSGIGLGAVYRLSSVFDIFSEPGKGTAVLSRFFRTSGPTSLITSLMASPAPLNVGAVCLPLLGEQECGDAWTLRSSIGSTLIMIADGLGHGPDAAVASNLAVSIFENQAPRGPMQLVQLIHAGLGSTRGAAVAVAELALDTRVVRFAGVGNIAGRILSGDTSRFLVSYNGTAGVEARKIAEFTYPWPEGAVIVLHSDGLATHWRLEDYLGLAQKDPALIAGVLFRDHRRPRDDSTVVVAK